ncbi:MAG: hypothetical protein HKN45_03420 [Flavobacteriales bacterium]|nr:hypothetical protein [Flavobacteriales bacterium]
MQSIKIIILTLLAASFCSCSNPSAAENQADISPKEEIKEDIIQYEESVPDSGLLEDVNPEEIITDDWSDDGDLELDTEK